MSPLLMRDPEHKAGCFTFWFRGHNNPRYAELFPRLEGVVRFYRVTFSRARLLRGAQFRLWRAGSRRCLYPAVLRLLRRRHGTLFTVDPWQIASWPHNVVADVDDPTYEPDEVRLLNQPQVRAVIVTTDRVRKIFQDLGIQRPIHVIPQGIPLQVSAERARQIRARFASDGEIVVGYHAPTLTLARDGPARPRQGQDDMDYLFAATEAARRTHPRIALWLLGEASPSVRAYAADRPWIRLLGYVPLAEILDHVAAFDVGVYPRTRILPPGLFSVKLAQFMACGVPIVSTNVNEAFMVEEAASGVVCTTQDAFSQALVNMAGSPQMRIRCGETGRRYAQAHLDWSRLIPRYESIIRDVLRTTA